MFTSCMKKSQSISEEELNRPDSVNILNNMYTRYCNESGNVHEHVLSGMMKFEYFTGSGQSQTIHAH